MLTTTGLPMLWWQPVASGRGAKVDVHGFPRSLLAPPNGETSIALTWTAVDGAVGAPVTGYRVEVSKAGDHPWLPAANVRVVTQFDHENLIAGTTRHDRVRTRNAAGHSAPSSVVLATTPALSSDTVTLIQTTASVSDTRESGRRCSPRWFIMGRPGRVPGVIGVGGREPVQTDLGGPDADLFLPSMAGLELRSGVALRAPRRVTVVAC